VLAVLLGFWAVTISRLGGLWSALPEYSYGWSVPLLCAMLLLERWRTRPSEMLKLGKPEILKDGQAEGLKYGNTGLLSAFSFQNFSVFLAALAFVLSRAALEVIPTWRFAAWTLALSTVALTLLLLKYFSSALPAPTSDLQPPTSRPVSISASQRFSVSHFAFPVLFFLLAVPWPDRFEGPFIQALTEFNAVLTVEVTAFLKIAAVRMGNIILIEPGMVGVQEACSGIRSFQSTLMVALFLGELFRFSFWRRVVFVFLGALLSFGFNIVRTSFLVWTCNRDGLGAVDKFHDPAGWTILAASVAGLALIGWWLYRSQRQKSGKQKAEIADQGQSTNFQGREQKAEANHGSTQMDTDGETSEPSTFHFQRSTKLPISIFCFLFFTLASTELGIRWWFASHEKPHVKQVDWAVRFDAGEANLKSLKITREVQAMLDYDIGSGWEWQGGGAERWQAFYFSWDKPKTLARRITCTHQALVHQPEICFTRAGMQVRQLYGKKRYLANGVPLVFKVYEFADRNIPIFVFACTWQANAIQLTTTEEKVQGDASTSRGIREAVYRYVHAERGVTDEVRVFKLGVWGPRTIGEAEASFQQQLNQLVQPVPNRP